MKSSSHDIPAPNCNASASDRSNAADRLEIEDALSESESNFRTFFETITDMVVVATLDGRILYANPAVSRILGYAPEDLERLHVLDINPEGQRAEAEEIFTAMFRGERDYCPLPVVHRDGSLLPAETRVWLGRWNGQKCIYSLVKDLSAEQEAQQRFERIFRNNPAMMALTTLPDRRYFDVNHAFLRSTGYSREEVIGATSAELHLMVQPERFAAAAQQLQSGNQAVGIEAQVRCKDGTILDGLFWGEQIRSQGRDYYLTLMLDVTEHKQLEAALQQSEADLRRAQAVAHLGSYHIDLQSKHTSWSEELPAIIGCPKEEFDYPGILSFIHPDDLPAVMQKQRSFLKETSLKFEQEYRLIRPDGAIRYVYDTGEVARDESGAPVMVFGTIQDVTERRLAEQRLRESEMIYRALFDVTNDGILLYDPNFKILRANSRMGEILGLTSANELIGRSIFDFMLPSEVEDARTRLALVLSGQAMPPYERILCHSDGSLIATELSLSLIRDRDHRPVYIQSVVRDISQRKRADEAIKQANQELRLRVEEIEKLHSELREQSLRDPLTGLYNRRYLDDMLARELLRAKRNQMPLSIMVVDLDYFKLVNDTYGHQMGDEFLVQVAALLTSSTRGSDFVCRYGGEEFLLVLPGASAQVARQRADEIREKCAHLSLGQDDKNPAITLSIGVAAYPMHGHEAEEIITKADKAMYQSKQAGRNQVTVWGESQSRSE